MQQDIRRYVSIIYLVSAACLAWLLNKVLIEVFALMGPGANRPLFAGIETSAIIALVVAFGTVVALWRHEKTYVYITEVVDELTKVTWPDQEDTRQATGTVIGFAFVLGISLALMDLAGRGVIDLIFRVFG